MTKIGLNKSFRLGFLVDIVIAGYDGRYFWYLVKRVAFASKPS